MTRDLNTELETIVKKKKVTPVYQFLKDLTHKERRGLMPTLKKLSKYYNEYLQQGNTWRARGTADQIAIINISRFVCSTGKEYERSGFSWLDQETVTKIFEFYIPEWFSEYVNKQALKEGYAPYRMEYDWMMELQGKGILTPSSQLIVKLLPQYLYDSRQKKGSYHVVYTRNDAKLLKYPDTLDKHIWLFFEEESNIHWTDHYMNSDDASKDLLSWKQTFKIHADNGQIDRQRLLKASLSTANMNFNKSSSGWFIDLFVTLEPTVDEMLKLQDAMFGVFNSPHSKLTNTVLKYFKKLCLEKGFSINEFLSNTPVLLSSETKSTVTSTLIILDKIAKIYPKQKEQICIEVSQAFVSNDSAIQSRAAKLIAKYGDIKSTDLGDTIMSYRDFLLTDATQLLSPFISNSEEAEVHDMVPEVSIGADDILSTENKVKTPENIDDLMFMASEAFDHNNELNFDIFPAALVEMNHLITRDNADRFEPALQRAYKNVMGDWRSGMGVLDHMLSVFFIDYTNILIRRFPNNTNKLKNLRTTFEAKEKENRVRFNNNTKHLYPFSGWFGKSDSRIYKPFFDKLIFILEQIKQGNILPVLSTPTHFPHWVDPIILISRIKKWQEKKMNLGHADLQFALSRCYLNEGDKLKQRIEDTLKGETKRLLSFLLDANSMPEGPYKNIAHWYTAALTKNPNVTYSEFDKFIYSTEAPAKFNGDYKWKVGKTAFENSKWDYKKGKMVNFTDYRKMLKIELSTKNRDHSFFKNMLGFKISPKPSQSLMIYGEVFLGRQWYDVNDNDAKRYYGMFPNNPENLLAKVCDKTLRYPEISGETFKRMHINTLESLLTRNRPFGNMTHLFIAGSLICSDKTARSLAAELWIQAETKGLIDSTKVGDIIGEHFAKEFAPLKRFTDLTADSMIRISSFHDKHLLELLEHILLGMNDIVVRGMKKLLEIYIELLRRSDANPPALLSKNLKAWSSSKSLAKQIKEIEKFRKQ